MMAAAAGIGVSSGLFVLCASALAALVTKWISDRDSKDASAVQLANAIATAFNVGIGACFLAYVFYVHISLMCKNASLWRKGFAADTSPPPLASERIDEENQLLRDAQREQQTIEFANKLRLARHLTMATAIYLLVSSWLTVSELLHKISLALALWAGLVLIMPLGLSVKAWCVHIGRDTATAPELQPILQRQQDCQDTTHQAQRPIVLEGYEDSNTAIL